MADHWQGRGIATLLLAQLAEAAAAEDVRQFTAVVLTSNRKMIGTFRDSGFPVEVRTRPGELKVTFPTTLTEDGRRRFEERERTAAVAAVEHVLQPRSVAIVGASRRPGSIGAAVMANLVAGGFTGPIYPINPHASTIEGLPAYASLREVPETPELAVVGVPAAQVVDVARDCAAAGVGALVVLSAGFSEVGEAGEQRQRELVAVCRAAGMRLVGPNCLGVINTDPGVSLNASFAPGAPPPGRVGFASQSGAFGIAALDLARTHGIGLSSFVSAGDKADLSGNDFLQYWEADERTDVIALYLESFGNPAKFGRIARRITARKPVIVVKSGRSAAGQRAASSHTGALLAAADTTVDALFRHAGVIRTDTVGEMFDVAAVLSRQPLPRGNRVAIVTNAGGPAILCTDACEADGLARRAARRGDPHSARRRAPRRGVGDQPGRHDRLGDRRGLRARARAGARRSRGGRGDRDLRPPARHARGRRGGRHPDGRGCAARRWHAGPRRLPRARHAGERRGGRSAVRVGRGGGPRARRTRRVTRGIALPRPTRPRRCRRPRATRSPR